MSNLYGYSDYNGPNAGTPALTNTIYTNLNYSHGKKEVGANFDANHSRDVDTEEINPLQVGFWMDGDSLAPPCGTSISTIHRIFEFASVTGDDIIYDLGCGDGRICLEAYALYNCQTVGVEVEADLISRANCLVDNYCSSTESSNAHARKPWLLESDLCIVLDQLVKQATKENFTPKVDLARSPSYLSRSSQHLPMPSLIILYLLPESLVKLESYFVTLLNSLPESFRIVCNTWGLPNLRSVREIDIPEANDATSSRVFVYTRQRP
jgi:SAM-dependent methyltransferase